MHISQLFDLELLTRMIEEGHVTERRHPNLPLRILNYAASCQFDNIWNEVTMNCRGLIVDDNNQVVARPFKKFFNLNTSYRPETHEINLPFEKPEVYDKLDGSLGILYSYGDYMGIATRGSFESEQARWATALLHNRHEYYEWLRKWQGSLSTWLFEIVFRENRIVVDYDFEDIVLLSVIHNLDGWEHSHDQLKTLWPWRVVEKFSKTLTECVAEQDTNREGYVLFYRDNKLRVKIKFEEYVRLHRLFTGVSPKSIWEMLKNGYDIEELCRNTTPSFNAWVVDWKVRMMHLYYGILNRSLGVYDTRPTGDRKAVAEYFLKFPDVSSICFSLLDNNGEPSAGTKELIWNRVKPKVGKGDVYRVDI